MEKPFVVRSFSTSSLQRNCKRESRSYLVFKNAFVREHCDIISGIDHVDVVAIAVRYPR